MATQSIAAMLDELMGKHRNVMPSERPKDPTWEDDDVCKHFLVSFCPHEMFVNTKADLGPCTKIHDERMKEAYRKSSRYEKMGFEEEYLSFLQKLHGNMENKIRRNKARLDLTQPDGQATDANKQRLEEKIKMLSEKVNSLITQAEILGAEGKVDEAQAVIQMCDKMRDEREQLREALEHSISQDKLMEVCEVCGCFLIVGDTQSRIDEHLLGKQHMGYAKIKATIDELIVSQTQTGSRFRIDEHYMGKQHMGYAKIKATIDELLLRKEEKRKQREAELAKEHEKRRSSRDDSSSKRGAERSRSSRDRDRDNKDSDRDKRRNSRGRDSDDPRRSSRDRDRDRVRKGRDDKDGRRSDRRSRSRSKDRRNRDRDRDSSTKHSITSKDKDSTSSRRRGSRDEEKSSSSRGGDSRKRSRSPHSKKDGSSSGRHHRQTPSEKEKEASKMLENIKANNGNATPKDTTDDSAPKDQGNKNGEETTPKECCDTVMTDDEGTASSANEKQTNGGVTEQI